MYWRALCWDKKYSEGQDSRRFHHHADLYDIGNLLCARVVVGLKSELENLRRRLLLLNYIRFRSLLF